MTNDCKRIVEEYVRTLEGAFTVHATDSGCVIVTPFARRDNDLIEIGVEPQPDGGFLLTDYGETMAYLALIGVNVSRSVELRRVVSQAARRFNVEVEQADISTYATEDTLGEALRNMIGAVSDLAYLVYKRRRRPPLSFDEKVEKILIDEGFGYDKNYPIRGKTELHRFRFYVDSGHRALIEPLAATSVSAALSKAERLAFRWTDIGEVRAEYQKIAVLDDHADYRSLWVGRPLEVLTGYSDAVLMWSRVGELPARVRRARMM